MTSLKQKIYIITAGLFIIIVAIFLYYPNNSIEQAVVFCSESHFNVDAKLDCFHELFRDAVKTDGIAYAYRIFAQAYDQSPEFVVSSCHEHAHVIGDTAYYEMYLLNPDFDSIDFPTDTVNCGYGFWHGFIEHLIQDRPDPAFLNKTCKYLDSRLGSDMSHIRVTCYHAAGHGFMLDPIDSIQDKQNWGDFKLLVKKPLENCNALNASEGEIFECKIGVFNVIGRWMFDGEYGLVYDLKDPFFECQALSQGDQLPCYNEMAQKLDTVSDWNLVKAAEYVEDIENDHWASKIIGVAAAGMILQDINDGSYFRYAEQCRKIPKRLHARCFKGIIAGLMEYGKPEEEYKKAVEFCTSSFVYKDELSLCHEILLQKFTRFYSKEKVEKLCKEVSLGFEEYCIDRGIL